MIKLKSDKRNFEAEVALYNRLKEITSTTVNNVLQCLHTHSSYHVLEHYGDDLRAYYGAAVVVRSGPLLKEILTAVFNLHKELHFIHGDLKPENIRVKDFRGRFSCKLCHFDNSCPLGAKFPRVGGELIITETWTCPELHRAKVNKDPAEVYGSAAMDIFNLGLIVNLLCYPHKDLLYFLIQQNSD